MTANVPPLTAAAPEHPSFATAFRFWLKLGFISFGGPAGQIAIMHEELVTRRHWISERRFLHALNYCMLLPGPEAQQLATYIGWLLHGTWGGVVAGVLFVLPSFFILVALSWLYVAFGQVPAVQGMLYGVQPAVVAIVAAAVLRIGSRAVRHPFALALAAGAFVALLCHVPFPLVILCAALLGLVGGRLWPTGFAAGGHGSGTSSSGSAAIIGDAHGLLDHARPSVARLCALLIVGLLLWALPLSLLQADVGNVTLAQMASFFTKAALVTFGGAYAVLPYVNDHAIAVGWLDENQMIHGLALGESTPGPLIMVVAFVGFVGGWNKAGIGWAGAASGAAVSTYFTFLPSFLFILLGGPLVERMRGEIRLNAALTGVTAAVVGVVAHLAYDFGSKVFIVRSKVDLVAVMISAVAFLALWRFKQSIVRVVVAGATLGLALLGLGGSPIDQ